MKLNAPGFTKKVSANVDGGTTLAVSVSNNTPNVAQYADKNILFNFFDMKGPNWNRSVIIKNTIDFSLNYNNGYTRVYPDKNNFLYDGAGKTLTIKTPTSPKIVSTVGAAKNFAAYTDGTSIYTTKNLTDATPVWTQIVTGKNILDMSACGGVQDATVRTGNTTTIMSSTTIIIIYVDGKSLISNTNVKGSDVVIDKGNYNRCAVNNMGFWVAAQEDLTIVAGRLNTKISSATPCEDSLCILKLSRYHLSFHYLTNNCFYIST
jgi:hypothetical protein